jgi:hypothetical protein
MKTAWWFALCAVLAVATVAAADSCLRFAVERNNDVESDSGVQAEVRVTNSCGEDLQGSNVWFKVTAFDSSHRALGAQTGNFDGKIEKSGEGKTWVFVSCDPQKVEKLEVEEEQ